MTIKLSVDDIKYMLSALELTPELRETLESTLRCEADLDDDKADELRDLAMDRLEIYGFGPNYEPTEEGKLLEGLIDRLFIG